MTSYLALQPAVSKLARMERSNMGLVVKTEQCRMEIIQVHENEMHIENGKR